MPDSVLSPIRQPGDDANPLRPLDLSRFVGQPQLKERVELLIVSARLRGEPVEHMLLSGPPGTGKTSLAGIVAKAAGGQLVTSSGPALRKPGEVVMMALMLERNATFFIDEIQALPRIVEETLYPALEDREIDLIGGGRGAVPMRTPIQPFTLIGATTEPGKLTAPLRNRFGVLLQFDFYSQRDLADIIRQSAEIIRVGIDDQAALAIAGAARGTPRIANRLLRRVRDYALVRAGNRIDSDVVARALAIEGVDLYGLDEQDRRYLSTLCDFYEGGPAGVAALAASMQADARTLTEVIEPYLLHNGIIIRSTAGRRVTPKGIRVYRESVVH